MQSSLQRSAPCARLRQVQQGRVLSQRVRAWALTAEKLSQPAASKETAVQESYKYRSLTKQGNTTAATVTHTKKGATIDVALGGFELDESTPTPYLHWGMYRASGNQWYHPKETVPPKSQLDSSSGGMRSPMTWDEQAGAWTARLTVPAKLLPLHLAMVFYYPDRRVYETPARSRYFSIPVGMSAGSADILGASVMSVSPPKAPIDQATCTVNFAVFSRHATAMYLALVRVQPETPGSTALQGSGVLEIALDPVTNKSGDIWHICVHGLRNIGLMCYGWRADGDVTWETGGRYHPGFLLSDPYATRVVPVKLPEAAYTGAPKLLAQYDVNQPVNLASLACFSQPFQWEGLERPMGSNNKPITHSVEDIVVLEINIDNFTTGSDAERYVARERRGKFLGILDRMREIQETGCTAVLLSPCCQTAPGMGPWGRNPTSLFAPDPRYAQGGPMTAAAELKKVVQAFHAKGIEVYMSVEYCMTGEGSDHLSGGLQGMRGLDAQTYYRALPDRTTVLATGHPVVRSMVVDSLNHWALEYGLDGFVVVNAENLVQDRHGTILDAPPLCEDICQDPVLKDLKLVAAPGSADLLPRTGVRGFPHWGAWQQVNDRFRTDLLAYLVDNAPGMLSTIATRISGSADLFGPAWDGDPPLPGCLAAGRRAAFSFNSLTPIGDQPLLQQLGADTNLERAEVLARTLFLLQFVSAGTPVISAATLSRKGLWRFVSILSSIRKQYKRLINPPITFAPAQPNAPPNSRELKWHGAAQGSEVDWKNTLKGAAPSNVIAFSIRDSNTGQALYVAVNPHPTPVQVALPGAGASGQWRLVVNTACLPPEDADLNGPLLDAGRFVLDVPSKAGILLLGAGAGATSNRTLPPPMLVQPTPDMGPSPGMVPPPARPRSPARSTTTWTPPQPAGGVPQMPPRY